METQLYYGLAEKHLSFRLREAVTADPDIEARFKGMLNTVTGEFQYRGTLKKYLSSGPLVKGSASEPLRLGAGVGVASGGPLFPGAAPPAAGGGSSGSGAELPFVTLSARKRLPLPGGGGGGEGDDGAAMVTLKARVDVDVSSGMMSRRAGARVTRRLLNFTQRQDLELSAGLDADWPAGGGGGGGGGRVLSSSALRGKPGLFPYLSVRENNWGVHLRRGIWSVTYDL